MTGIVGVPCNIPDIRTCNAVCGVRNCSGLHGLVKRAIVKGQVVSMLGGLSKILDFPTHSLAVHACDDDGNAWHRNSRNNGNHCGHAAASIFPVGFVRPFRFTRQAGRVAHADALEPLHLNDRTAE